MNFPFYFSQKKVLHIKKKIFSLIFLNYLLIKIKKMKKVNFFFALFLLVALFNLDNSFAQYTNTTIDDDKEGGLSLDHQSGVDQTHARWYMSLRDNNTDMWFFREMLDRNSNPIFWNPIQLKAGNDIILNGNIGINQSAPSVPFEVVGNSIFRGTLGLDGGTSQTSLTLTTTNTNGNKITFIDGNGGYKTLTVLGGTNGYLDYGGIHLLNTGYMEVPGMVKAGNGYYGFTPNGNNWTGFDLHSGTSQRIILGVDNGPARNVFDIEKDGTWEHMMELRSDGSAFFMGNTAIGTSNVSNTYKLSVLGKIRATEIVVETGWSDFVFEKNYKLRSLSEVEQFVNENKHLPDIPSEKEVTENGVSLGEMQSKLLQKVEELTLYIIDQNKRIEKLEKENEELKR
ncbi:MAG: hypothetical protein K1X86_06530 [Ignavibacteria bacterium]|nr:hypothetical protein [Ignavibacteria bacterium]